MIDLMNREIDHWSYYMHREDRERIGTMKVVAWGGDGVDYCFTLLDRLFASWDEDDLNAEWPEISLTWRMSGFPVVCAGAQVDPLPWMFRAVTALLDGPHWQSNLTSLQDETAYAVRQYGQHFA